MFETNEITIIGNNNLGNPATDGGRVKIRLYIEALKKEGKLVKLIDIENAKKHPFKTLKSIKRAFATSGSIILMSCSRISRFLVPYLSKLKRKAKNKPKISYSPIGIGTISAIISKRLTPEQQENFLSSKNFYGITDKKMGKCLKEFDYICLENQTLINVYKKFYGLANLVLISNFRMPEKIAHVPFSNIKEKLRLVYLARINESKGIFDLIYAVKEVNKSNARPVVLDIFGKMELTKETLKKFTESISSDIRFMGEIKSECAIKTISKYDFYVFPVKSHEGTPGSLIESMISGTPSICSSITQINEFVESEKTGLIYSFGSKEGLVEAIKKATTYNQKMLVNLSTNVLEKSKMFTYDFYKTIFLKCFSN